jgi:hypothetical protein
MVSNQGGANMAKNLKVKIGDMINAAKKIEHKAVIRCTAIGHLSYYWLVGLEAHGSYRYPAMVLGALLIIESLQGRSEEA